jgi:hypothetical protein
MHEKNLLVINNQAAIFKFLRRVLRLDFIVFSVALQLTL